MRQHGLPAKRQHCRHRRGRRHASVGHGEDTAPGPGRLGIIINALRRRRAGPDANLNSKEGVGALYKGVGVVVATAAPAQGLFFLGNDTAREALRPHLPAAAASFAAGCVAQLCGSLCWVPMDTVKERLQVEGPAQTRVQGRARRLLERGPNDPAAGRVAGILSGVLGPPGDLGALQRPLLRHLRGVQGRRCPRPGQRGGRRRRGGLPHEPHGPGEDAAAGGAHRPLETFAYAGAFDCVGQILRREGPLAFLDGAIARCATVAPG